jgi:predicted O-methyltransferase YrrM
LRHHVLGQVRAAVAGLLAASAIVDERELLSVLAWCPGTVGGVGDARNRVAAARRRLYVDGPQWTRAEGDFARISLPRTHGDVLRDLLVAERAGTVVEIGLAYGASALAIGEALRSATAPSHVIIDPFQTREFSGAGRDVLREAGLDAISRLIEEPSSAALPELVADGLTADAASLDGSHRFHEVFLDLYYLRMIVRPGGLVVLDDTGCLPWRPPHTTS